MFAFQISMQSEHNIIYISCLHIGHCSGYAVPRCDFTGRNNEIAAIKPTRGHRSVASFLTCVRVPTCKILFLTFRYAMSLAITSEVLPYSQSNISWCFDILFDACKGKERLLFLPLYCLFFIFLVKIDDSHEVST